MGLIDRLEGKSAALAAFERAVRAAEGMQQVKPAQVALVQAFKALGEKDQTDALDFLLKGLYATTFETCARQTQAAPSMKAFEKAADASVEIQICFAKVSPAGYRIPRQDEDQAQAMFLDAYRRMQATDQRKVLEYLTQNGEDEIFNTCSRAEP